MTLVFFVAAAENRILGSGKIGVHCFYTNGNIHTSDLTFFP